MRLEGRRLHFALAALVLGGSAAEMQYAKQTGSLQLVKKVLPIRKPLKDLDRSRLAPLRLVLSRTMPPDTVQELGTEEYIDWAMENPASVDPSEASVNMTVTYYTGMQDQVPHVPEECFQQGAFSLDSDTTMAFNVPALGETIPVRRMTFIPPPVIAQRDPGAKTVVYYTICVNGGFYAVRNRVRIRMAALDEPYLYYSKVELGFRSRSSGDLDRLDRAAAEYLGKALPELVRAHWPIKGAEKTGPAAERQTTQP